MGTYTLLTKGTVILSLLHYQNKFELERIYLFFISFCTHIIRIYYSRLLLYMHMYLSNAIKQWMGQDSMTRTLPNLNTLASVGYVTKGLMKFCLFILLCFFPLVLFSL